MGDYLSDAEVDGAADGPDPSENGGIVNKAGQKLGRKGLETRTRLLQAILDLLETTPQSKLTPSTIARKAGLASQSFYLYFADVEEALLVLCADAARDIDRAVWSFKNASMPEFVKAYYEFWDRHRALFSIRNYYSDNGEPRFLRLRAECSMPIVDAITRRIEQTAGIGHTEAMGRAVVVFSALDRMAARAHLTSSTRPGELSNADLMRAEADVLSLVLDHRGDSR